MKLKTKLLNAALLAALGVAGSAQAVVQSESGTGQVLLYPYYSVQNGNDTYMSVVNTTARAKAVKVRFLEAKNSREVLDFNLYLSPWDVWTAAIVATDGGGAAVRTTDNSCTAPLLSAGSGGSTGTMAGRTYLQQAFRNYAYANDGAGSGLDRTREGYIEIIEMGDINSNYVLPSSGAANTNFQAAVTHSASGVPANCDAVRREWDSSSNFPVVGTDAAVLAPTGGLIGRAEIINVPKGVDFPADPVALDWFSTIALHTQTGSDVPSLQQASPRMSTVFAGSSSAAFDVLTTNWAVADAITTNLNAADAVSAVLMRDSVLNEYSTEASVKAGTDWVINFPTKRFYVNAPVAGSNKINSQRPFSSNFTKDGACEAIGMNIYDREEQGAALVPGDFSPTPPAGSGASLCWEVNVMTINKSKVLGGELTSYDLETEHKAGWIDMSFPNVTVIPEVAGDATVRHQMVATPASTLLLSTGAAPTGTSVVYRGLPVIGFSAQALVNGAVSQGVLSNYSSTSAHKYRTSITY